MTGRDGTGRDKWSASHYREMSQLPLENSQHPTTVFSFSPLTPSPFLLSHAENMLSRLTSAVRACRAAGQAEEALSLLEAMRREKPAAGAGAVAEAEAEAGVNLSPVLRPDAFCFNICIDACAKGGLHERALALLGEMRLDGVAPDVVRLCFRRLGRCSGGT